jgi:hypothetical protein
MSAKNTVMLRVLAANRTNVRLHLYLLLYRVFQEESAILWEMIVSVILSKKVHMNMGPILNGYRDMYNILHVHVT